MSKQSSRRFSRPSHQRRDDDYSRRTRQDSNDGRKRQLFDPFSDNPIGFNRPAVVEKPHEQQETQTEIATSSSAPTTAASGRRSYLVQRREGLLLRNLDEGSRRDNAGNRRLWNPTDDKKPPTPQQQPAAPQREIVPKRRVAPPVAAIEPAKKSPAPAPSDPVKEEHKRKIKAMFASIQEIEGRLVQVDADGSKLAFFKSEDDEHQHQQQQLRQRRRSIEQVDPKPPPRQLTEADLTMAAKVWREKMELHMALANKYLDVIQFDYVFAEKKSLESLCWKRAIYSLVEQFRAAFKVRMTEADDLEDGLEEEDGEDNVIAESAADMPVFSNMSPGEYDNDDDNNDELMTVAVTKADELDRLRGWFAEFLDQADDFYRRSMIALRAMDASSETDEEKHLQEWRRTRRLKWYKAVPNRGDLARYRWAYASSDQDAFLRAWRWYALGVWLMPATGKLYFHLSLLITRPGTTDPGHDLHRLYFSVRSLMVRRNGFLNAREGMIVLFESNRRWVDKYLKTIQSAKGSRFGHRAKKVQQQQQQQLQQQDQQCVASDDEVAAGLFIRLHGMMFTKISLDQFAQVKRRFFSCLFPDTGQIEGNGNGDAVTLPAKPPTDGLSACEVFWFEAAVTCLSSLYSYDYASSKLTKLTILQGKRLYSLPSAGTATNDDGTAKSDNYNELLEELRDSVLFAYDVDLMCGIAVQLFRRALDSSLPRPATPALPVLPTSPTSLHDNHNFIFEAGQPQQQQQQQQRSSYNPERDHADEPWIIFIEVMLHWMVVNSVCQRPTGGVSLWEALVGNAAADLVRRTAAQDNTDTESSNISPVFWPLLLEFLNSQLQSLEDDVKYELVDRFLHDDDDDDDDDTAGEYIPAERTFAKLATKALGKQPTLPEEMHMRGLGWVDDITGKLLKIGTVLDGKASPAFGTGLDLLTQRKIKVLSYGFALARQMNHVFCYDPVLEMFAVNKGLEEEQVQAADAQLEQDARNTESSMSDSSEQDTTHDPQLVPTIEAMDDAVLFSNENDSVDEDGDMLTQLKKRREQLQAMLTTTGSSGGYRRAPGRLKEREARLNRLRERVIPGRTTIVLDTNCFIGHINHVQRLISCGKWAIVIPLVVITELDGLRSNTPPLGAIAGEALSFIEASLASKQRSSTSLRIQTSHNNFMHDISIRSEQFVFGETDKNLDDLVLSACLWWARDGDGADEHARVCLVTGDRNLSVKARARDIDVMSVSAIMQLTPKK